MLRPPQRMQGEKFVGVNGWSVIFPYLPKLGRSFCDDRTFLLNDGSELSAFFSGYDRHPTLRKYDLAAATWSFQSICWQQSFDIFSDAFSFRIFRSAYNKHYRFSLCITSNKNIVASLSCINTPLNRSNILQAIIF